MQQIKQEMIGELLDPILSEIEGTLLEFAARDYITKPNFSKESLRSATYIFMSVLMDKMFEHQDYIEMSLPQREEMADKAGRELRDFVMTYTGIDTYKFYE